VLETKEEQLNLEHEKALMHLAKEQKNVNKNPKFDYEEKNRCF